MSDQAGKTRDKRTKPRIKVEVHAQIKAQLIGSATKYPFVTENISESGLLITHAPGFKPAFNKHSILEVWVQNDQGEEIFFFAKYVRKASDHSFGVKIIDIDGVNSKKYSDFIDSHKADILPEGSEEDEEAS